MKRYEAVEETLKELKLKKKYVDIFRTFGELVLDKQMKLISKELKNDNTKQR